MILKQKREKSREGKIVFLLAFLYTQDKKLLFHEESHQISIVPALDKI